MEPSPFGDLFGEPQDIFAADVRTDLMSSFLRDLCASTFTRTLSESIAKSIHVKALDRC